MALDEIDAKILKKVLKDARMSYRKIAGKQTFRSAFDTFVSSEPGGYGIYEDKKSNVFKPGETFLVYVESLGYTYGTVTDEDGNTLV
jgi:hypothetical protein